MCHHICPIGNATGQERCTPRARALGLSLVSRDAIKLSEVIDNIYECAACGACVHDCYTGWDPVMFTREAKLAAALDGVLPDYINKMLDTYFEHGSIYGKPELTAALKSKINSHGSASDTLFYIGDTARAKADGAAISAIELLERAGVDFALLENEEESGAELDFLIGAAEEAKAQMEKCNAQLAKYKKVIIYDPEDARVIKQRYKEYGIEASCATLTFTSYLAELLEEGKLTPKKRSGTAVFQDPSTLARDLSETEPARKLISSVLELKEMLLHGEETVFAGSLIMAEYMPNVMKNTARTRIGNALSVGENRIVTASVSEYVLMKSVCPEGTEILSIEELLGE